MGEYIYALVDPRTHERRYIGRSCNPAARLRTHLYAAASKAQRHMPLYVWLNELAALDLQPCLEVLESVDSTLSNERETQCIREHHRQSPGRLLNINGKYDVERKICRMPRQMRDELVSRAEASNRSLNEAVAATIETGLPAVEMSIVGVQSRSWKRNHLVTVEPVSVCIALDRALINRLRHAARTLRISQNALLVQILGANWYEVKMAVETREHTLWFPVGLLEEYRRISDESGRSLNSLLVTALVAYLHREDGTD